MQELKANMQVQWMCEMQTRLWAEVEVHQVVLQKDMHKIMKDYVNAETKAMESVKDKEMVELKSQLDACKNDVSVAMDKESQKSREAIAAMEANVVKVITLGIEQQEGMEDVSRETAWYTDCSTRNLG